MEKVEWFQANFVFWFIPSSNISFPTTLPFCWKTSLFIATRSWKECPSKNLIWFFSSLCVHKEWYDGGHGDNPDVISICRESNDCYVYNCNKVEQTAWQSERFEGKKGSLFFRDGSGKRVLQMPGDFISTRRKLVCSLFVVLLHLLCSSQNDFPFFLSPFNCSASNFFMRVWTQSLAFSSFSFPHLDRQYCYYYCMYTTACATHGPNSRFSLQQGKNW